MKIGDYVRTECGIAKIKNFETKNKEVIELDKDIMICNMDCYRNCCTINQGIKSSPNIIDLIEVGDYVNLNQINGGIVINKNDNEINTWNILPNTLKNEDIKSVITREQLLDMEYRIGE